MRQCDNFDDFDDSDGFDNTINATSTTNIEHKTRSRNRSKMTNTPSTIHNTCMTANTTAITTNIEKRGQAKSMRTNVFVHLEVQYATTAKSKTRCQLKHKHDKWIGKKTN